MADLIPLVPDPQEPLQTRGIVLTRAAGVYDLLSPPMLFWQEQSINRKAAALLPLTGQPAVLDVGCATGAMTFAIEDRLTGGLAVGIDASGPMIAQARKKIRGRRCRFDMGLAEKLPYPSSSFDAAASTFFFHHLNLEDKLRALKEIFRVLKPTGSCVIVDIDTPANLMGRISCAGATLLFRQPEIAENAQGKLRPLFAEAGFRKIVRRGQRLGYLTTFLMEKP